MSVRFRDMFCRLLIKSIIGVVAGCWMTALTYDVAIAQVLTSSPLPSVPSASATPVNRTSASPSPTAIKQNMLLLQQASLNQAITVAKACIKNATLPQVLRDPQGNVNTVPSTDLINCTRTLTALLDQLAANQKALTNLSQDAQMEAARIVAQTNQLKLQQRLQILSQGLPMTLNPIPSP
ncbi:MAG: hypothetical protein ACYDHG_09095 [Desulfomonilaceae bacterium]